MISEEDVKHIASLARLEVKEEDLGKMVNDLSAVLGYVEKLNKVDTIGVSATMHASLSMNVFRDDESPDEIDKELAKELVESASMSEGGYVKVKSILP